MNCETGNRAKGRKINEVEIIISVWIIVENLTGSKLPNLVTVVQHTMEFSQMQPNCRLVLALVTNQQLCHLKEANQSLIQFNETFISISILGEVIVHRMHIQRSIVKSSSRDEFFAPIIPPICKDGEQTQASKPLSHHLGQGGKSSSVRQTWNTLVALTDQV